MDNWGKVYLLVGEKMQNALSAKDTSVEDLNIYFSWFNDVFSAAIKETYKSFWKITPEIRLFSLEKNSKNFFQGNNYFVTQAEISTVSYSLRLSDSACDAVLTKSLGTNDSKYFTFPNMTELEANIVSKFNNVVFQSLSDYILSPKEVKKMIDNEISFADYVNLGFIINENTEDFEIGKLFLSIPQNLIKYPDIPEREGVIDITRFTKAQTPVDILVGKTRLTLDDIKNLETEDIVVLEKSNIKKMKIIGENTFVFNVNPDPRLFINEETEENEETNTQKEDIEVSGKDMWDNVQVDVCAKFPKVKVSLGELREMTEGVVMELDSIYGNKITLEVEDKNIAKGELVIIGYKYGIKITEICSQNDEEESDAPTEENSSEDDDFDVKDFEIEE